MRARQIALRSGSSRNSEQQLDVGSGALHITTLTLRPKALRTHVLWFRAQRPYLIEL